MNYRPDTIDIKDIGMQAEPTFKMVIFLPQKRFRDAYRRRVKDIYLYQRKRIGQGNVQLPSALLVAYKGIRVYLVILNKSF